MSMTRLLIAASGTGGHLFPALAVAEALPPDWSIHWLGVPDRLERELVPSRFPLHTVRAGGLQGRGLKKLWQLLRLLAATGTVRRLIRREGVDLVFSTGGYIAAPAILAARWCGVPVVLHESNAVPGRVTRLLGRLCSQVALGLPQAAGQLGGCQPVVTGTPVRQAFLEPAPLPAWVPDGAGPLLLVMGGSQGAVGLNRMLRPLLPRLLAAGCRVVHLSGSNDGAAAAALGAAVIVLQHPPDEPPLERAIWRLLGPRLRRVETGGKAAGDGPSPDPLLELRRGMGRLAQRDADRQLAQVLQGLVGARD